MNKSIIILVVLPLILSNFIGCASKQSFSTSGRPGETVALSVGWHPDLKRENLTVTIQPCLGGMAENTELNNTATCSNTSGNSIVYTASSAELRAVANMYPDPVSRLVFKKETNQKNSGGASSYSPGDFVEYFHTNRDKEYLLTSILMDIPVNIPANSEVLSVEISDTEGAQLKRLYIEVHHSPYNSTARFKNWSEYTFSDNTYFRDLERTTYRTVTFSGASVPHTIQLDINHGAGKFYVINPRGDIKNISWADTNLNLRVMLTPAWNKDSVPLKDGLQSETLSEFSHFKFYVAGDVDTGALSIPAGSIMGFDINGDSVTGLTATIQ